MSFTVLLDVVQHGVGSPTILLVDTYYWSQIIMAIVAVFGIPFTIYQLYNSKKESNAIREREIRVQENAAIQKSIDLAGYYKDNILRKVSIIKHVYKASGIMDILKKIDTNKMYAFDEYELESLLSEKEIEQIRTIQGSEKFLKILIQHSMIFNFGEKYIKQNVATSDIENKVINIDVHPLGLHREYQELVNEILNNLEYFSMYFTHEVADHSVVYQSLHLSYIEVMQMYYVEICLNNKKVGPRLYTNAIDLYRTWKKKSDEADKACVEVHRCNVDKGNLIKR